MVAWDESGRGVGELDINDVRRLAISSGFTFDGEHDLSRQADLGGFFRHYGVNSLTAFQKLFYTTPLSPDGIVPREAARWEEQRRQNEYYFGEVLDSRERHGFGRLLYQVGQTTALYEGHFAHGSREGFGVLTAKSGHTYLGQFKDGQMWGHGVFVYPTHSKEGKRPAKFEGVFQGKPHGKGIHTLVNGEEHGVFEGTKRVGEADVHACKTMAATARQHAEAARRVQEHVREELRKQNREDNGK